VIQHSSVSAAPMRVNPIRCHLAESPALPKQGAHNVYKALNDQTDPGFSEIRTGAVAVQSRELNLKRLAVWVDVHHSPYVADLQTFLSLGTGAVRTTLSCSRIIARYAGTST
jgi:hypothetical protein